MFADVALLEICSTISKNRGISDLWAEKLICLLRSFTDGQGLIRIINMAK